MEAFKKQSFVLKEGVEYRIKISFRVSRRHWEGPGGGQSAPLSPTWGLSLQVNREIVSGMKYIQHTYRKGVKSE